MKVFHREFGHRYDTYEFGYTAYARLEKSEETGMAYETGFLPYSADPLVRDLFYMARSVRVPLGRFALSSENRRILRKFEGQFASHILTKEELAEDSEFLPCFLSYFASRHGERVMSEERARGILATPLPLRAIKYEKAGSTAGYVLEIAEGNFSHYWYSCYDEAYIGTSFGMWLMLDAVERAQQEQRSHAYLGTAYGAKGRYKTNFSSLEFWNGEEWVEDEKLLKSLIREGADQED